MRGLPNGLVLKRNAGRPFAQWASWGRDCSVIRVPGKWADIGNTDIAYRIEQRRYRYDFGRPRILAMVCGRNSGGISIWVEWQKARAVGHGDYIHVRRNGH